ncbi:MAG: hypothetical protein AAFY56_02970 [Pseudomonadota bacterium]
MATAIGTRPLAASADPMASFKRWLTAAVVVDVVFGLVAIIWPRWVTEFLHLGDVRPTIWVRMIGLYAIVLALSFLPALIIPLGSRILSIWACKARFLFAIFFVFAAFNVASGFWLVVAYDVILGLVLTMAFWRGFRTDLMSRP